MNDAPWLFTLAVVVLLLWVWNPFAGWGDEVTVYPAQCAEAPSVRSDGCSGYYTLNRTTYLLDDARREAVYWSTHEGGPPRGRLVNCLSRDIRNWSCFYTDGSGPVALRDGLALRHQYEKTRAIVYLRRWQWWYIRLMGHVMFPVPFDAMVPEQFN